MTTKNRIVKAIINEASLSRVYNHTQNRNIGLISAARGDKDAATNDNNHRELGNKIRKAGYGHIKVHGGYTENKGTPQERYVKEKSYLVVGKKGHDNGQLLGHLKKWGKQYEQDGVVHKPHDNEEATHHGLKDGVDTFGVGKWHPNRASDYASHLRKAKSDKGFVFEDIQFITTSASQYYRDEVEF